MSTLLVPDLLSSFDGCRLSSLTHWPTVPIPLLGTLGWGGDHTEMETCDKGNRRWARVHQWTYPESTRNLTGLKDPSFYGSRSPPSLPYKGNRTTGSLRLSKSGEGRRWRRTRHVAQGRKTEINETSDDFWAGTDGRPGLRLQWRERPFWDSYLFMSVGGPNREFCISRRKPERNLQFFGDLQSCPPYGVLVS